MSWWLLDLYYTVTVIMCNTVWFRYVRRGWGIEDTEMEDTEKEKDRMGCGGGEGEEDGSALVMFLILERINMFRPTLSHNFFLAE